MTEAMLQERETLPAPLAQPLDAADPAFAALTPFELEALARLRGKEPVYLLIHTRSRADVGCWFRRRRLWLACLPREMLIFATGAKDHLERYAFRQIEATFYNPITGELVVAEPHATSIIRTLRVSVDEARQVLAQIAATTKEP